MTLGGSQLATLVLVQAAVLLLVRAVGPEMAGRYSAAVAVTSTLAFLLSCGTSAALIRRGSVNPEIIPTFTRRALELRLVVFGPFIALVTGTAWFLGWSTSAVLLVAFASVSALANSLQQLAKANLELRQRFTALAVAGSFNSFFDAGIVALIVAWCGGSLGLGLLFQGLLGTLSATAMLWRATQRRGPADGRYPMGAVFRESMPFLFAGFFYALNIRVDTVMIASARPAAEVGYWNAATRLVMVGYLLPLTVSTVLRSRFFALAARGPEAIAAIYRETSRLSAAVTLPASVALSVVGSALLPHLYGEAFRPGGVTLALLAPAMFLRASAMPACDVLTAFNRQHLRTVLEGASVGLNVLLNLVALPLGGIAGVAVATVCSEAALTVSARVLAGQLLDEPFSFALSAGPLGATAMVGIGMAALRLAGMPALACLAAGTLAYVAVALPFGVIDVADLRRLRAREVRA
jgi:O-antigen/teichoic acid export membrane protein